VRSLIDHDGEPAPSRDPARTLFDLQAAFRARGAKAEQILLILLEGIRNTVRHADARAAVIRTAETDGVIHITIDDDGVGFSEIAGPPWSIASRVAELGGEMRIIEAPRPGAHLEIELPTG
jgi:signal transduction histidine kinase